MIHTGTWSPYAGSSSIIFSVVLLIITCLLIFFAMRLPQPIAVKRPGRVLGVTLNLFSKILEFATAVSLFLPSEKSAWFVRQSVLARKE